MISASIRRSLVAGSLLALSMAVLAACGARSSGGRGPILVGEYGSLTGSEASFGQSTHRGITLALEEINAAGGIRGRSIRVTTEDDQSKPEEAASAASKLISRDGVVAVIGEVGSSSSLAAAPICQANRVPMISPSSTNPDVTRKGSYIFRMCFIDTYQGPVMAEYLVRDLGIRRAAILMDSQTDYSRGLAEAFRGRFAELGGRILAQQSYSKGDSDFRGQLTALRSVGAQIIYVPGYYNDVAQIAIQARDLGLNQPLVGGDGWESPKLLEIGGSALEGCFYSNHYHADDPAPAVRNFVIQYNRRFGARPDSLAALGYDSMKVLADAMKRAGTTRGEALRDAIAATKGFPGVTGSIAFGPDRNPIGKKLVVLEIRGGALALKSLIDPSAARKE